MIVNTNLCVLAIRELSSIFNIQLLADIKSIHMLDDVPFANFLGYLALVTYILTLLPSILRVVFPNTKKAEFIKWLFKYRRHIGVASFWFTVGHGYFFVLKRNFDFFDIDTYLQYYTGVSSFIIFTLLAVTSNDWSIKKLGAKNWKTLHQLTYLAIFLLLLHIWNNMSGDWTFLTPVGIIGMGVIIVLFFARKWLERREKQQKDKKKQPKAKLPSQASG